MLLPPVLIFHSHTFPMSCRRLTINHTIALAPLWKQLHQYTIKVFHSLKSPSVIDFQHAIVRENCEIFARFCMIQREKHTPLEITNLNSDFYKSILNRLNWKVPRASVVHPT